MTLHRYGYTIMEKNVDKLCLIFGEKVTLSTSAMLIQVLLSEALPDPPTLIDDGREEL